MDIEMLFYGFQGYQRPSHYIATQGKIIEQDFVNNNTFSSHIEIIQTSTEYVSLCICV